MADTELLTEHFGYPPVSLLDDVINSVNILAERALNSVEQGLLNAPPASLGFKSKPPPKYNAASEQQPWNPAEAVKAEIEAGTHQLETLLCASIDRNLDKFELFVLRNFLCVQPVDIRDWMRLSHYDGLEFLDAAVAADVALAAGQTSNGSASDVPTLESINELRRKLRESMRLNALLTAERERNARTLQKLQHLVLGGNQIKTEIDDNNSNSRGTPSAPAAADSSAKEKHGPSPFAFLQQKGTLSAAGGSTPLGTTTAFTLSQLQALRALSESLRNVTPDLSAPTPPEDGDDEAEHDKDRDDDERQKQQRRPSGMLEDEDKYRSKSWRRQRTEYVEHATRRHLEIVHGLELGRHGEVRDGEWQGAGRQLAHGEVEGLERVAAILGREELEPAPGARAPATTTAATKTATKTTGEQQKLQQQQQQQQEDESGSGEQPHPQPTSTLFSASTTTTSSTTRRTAAGSTTTATPAAITTPAAKKPSRVTKSTATTPATAARVKAAMAAATLASSQKEPPPSVRTSALRRTPPPGSASKAAATPPAAARARDGGGEGEEGEEDLMDMS